MLKYDIATRRTEPKAAVFLPPGFQAQNPKTMAEPEGKTIYCMIVADVSAFVPLLKHFACCIDTGFRKQDGLTAKLSRPPPISAYRGR